MAKSDVDRWVDSGWKIAPGIPAQGGKVPDEVVPADVDDVDPGTLFD